MSNVILKDFNNLIDGMQSVLNQGTQNLIDLTKKVSGIQSDLNYLKVENSEIKLQQKSMFQKLEKSEENSTKALEKITIRDNDNFGADWLSQKDLGMIYEPVISSRQMGTILKAIGLAMKNKKNTTPLQSTLKNGYVKRGYTAGWCWYTDKVKSEFKKYLKNKDLYSKFLTLNTEEEMKNFINDNIKIGDI
jgi:regulator of replication initiation timing